MTKHSLYDEFAAIQANPGQLPKRIRQSMVYCNLLRTDKLDFRRKAIHGRVAAHQRALTVRTTRQQRIKDEIVKLIQRKMTGATGINGYKRFVGATIITQGEFDKLIGGSLRYSPRKSPRGVHQEHMRHSCSQRMLTKILGCGKLKRLVKRSGVTSRLKFPLVLMYNHLEGSILVAIKYALRDANNKPYNPNGVDKSDEALVKKCLAKPKQKKSKSTARPSSSTQVDIASSGNGSTANPRPYISPKFNRAKKIRRRLSGLTPQE
jgi:hypothetical protein